jgi:hypothetical protein
MGWAKNHGCPPIHLKTRDQQMHTQLPAELTTHKTVQPLCQTLSVAAHVRLQYSGPVLSTLSTEGSRPTQ